MLPSADTKFDYAALPTDKAASARAAAERIRGRMQLAAESIIEVGRELIEQKKQLGHGNFLPWIEAEFGMSQASANRFMQVATSFGTDSSRVTNLNPKALYALAAPSTPEPVREAVLEQAAAGEKVTAREIEALKRKLSKAEDTIAEKEAQRKAQEGLAEAMSRAANDQSNRAMFAEADKERLTQQVEELVDEISRLKEDGVIHVEQARVEQIAVPQPPFQRVDAMLIALKAMWEHANGQTREAFLDWITEPEEIAA